MVKKKRVKKKEVVHKVGSRKKNRGHRKFRHKIKKSVKNHVADVAKKVVVSLPKITHSKLDVEKKVLPGVDVKDSEIKGKVLEEYRIEVDGAKVSVKIVKGDFGIVYNLIIPEVSAVTETLLTDLRNELVSATTVSMKEILDPSAFDGIKKKFIVDAEGILKKKLPNTTEETKNFLIGKLIQDMLGLGEIEFMVNDPNLEEIVILSSKESIRVYHKKYKWIQSNIVLQREDRIVNYSKIIARRWS